MRFKSKELKERYGIPVLVYEPDRYHAKSVSEEIRDGEQRRFQTRTTQVIGTLLNTQQQNAKSSGKPTPHHRSRLPQPSSLTGRTTSRCIITRRQRKRRICSLGRHQSTSSSIGAMRISLRRT
jgi:hypothetical protein